jgi:ribonuclease P protein component
MLKKANRLRVSRHFKRAYEKGQRIAGRFVKISAFHNLRQIDAPAKVAVVVSKQNIAQATDRNLWRRRTKVIFTEYLENLQGWELVINLNKSVKTADFATLKEDISKCVEKLPLH